MIEKLGFKADAVSNGKEALDLIQRVPYSAIFMDCHMPVMDGFQATELIRKLEPSHISKIPIIALTAYASDVNRERCFKVGMNDYLSKPVKLDELARVFSRWICEPASVHLEQDLAPVPSESTLPNVTLDRAVLNRLQRQLGSEVATELQAELFSVFTRATPLRIELLEKAIASGDSVSVNQIAHTMRAASATVGANTIANLCAQLEAMNEHEISNQAPRLTKKIQAELKSYIQEFNAL